MSEKQHFNKVLFVWFDLDAIDSSFNNYFTHSIEELTMNVKCPGKPKWSSGASCWLIFQEMLLQLQRSPPVLNSVDWTCSRKANSCLRKVPQLHRAQTKHRVHGVVLTLWGRTAFSHQPRQHPRPPSGRSWEPPGLSSISGKSWKRLPTQLDGAWEGPWAARMGVVTYSRRPDAVIAAKGASTKHGAKAGNACVSFLFANF